MCTRRNKHYRNPESSSHCSDAQFPKMVSTSPHTTKKTSSVDSLAGNMIPLDSILNLRRVDARGKLFRSARQDRASTKDIQHLTDLGIRTFLDLRSCEEYRKSTLRGKSEAFDQDVQVVVPELNPKTKLHSTSNTVPLMDLNGKPVRITSPQTPKRYLINMISRQMFFEVFKMAPLYKRLFSLLLIIVDFIFGTGRKYFSRYYSDEINRFGVVGLYVGLLMHGGKQLCFILKMISDPKNLPALLCCAFGKDRTGVVTAMVLSIMGKSDEYIAKDYAMSEEGLESDLSTVQREILLEFNICKSFASAKKETMLKTLATLRDRYGSVENYLESIGFGKEDQEKLRQVLS